MSTKDKAPAILRLMKYTDLSLFLNDGNLGLFIKLEEALIADEKSVNDFGGYQEDFADDLSNTEDLYENQGPILSAMITAWAKSVLGEFMNGLHNACTDSLGINTDTSGGVYCMTLKFTGLDDYIANINEDNCDDILNVLNQWEHTAELIINMDDLKVALTKFTSDK